MKRYLNSKYKKSISSVVCYINLSFNCFVVLVITLTQHIKTIPDIE